MRLSLALIGLLLTGCAGAEKVEANNPYQKLGYADWMMYQDRAGLAESLIDEAIKIFEENGDEGGIADSYNAYGNLYKHPSYHGKWKPTFEAMGTYDGTYQKSLDYFNKAKDLFEKRNDVTGVSKSLVGIGNVYGIKEEKEKSCQYYQKALDHYQTGKEKGLVLNEPAIYDRRYKNLGELIQGFISGYCKS